MSIPAQYNPTETENKWYEYWMKNRYFHSEPNDKPAFADPA